jgi:hypothetical protein
MPCGSDVPPLCERADRSSASRHRREAVAALLSVARAEDDQPEGRHSRAVRRAGYATVYRNSIRRVAFTRGEIQLAARGADLTLDITARHFDVAGYLRLEHACGRLTRVEAQRLIAALLAFLASTTETSEMADRPDSLTIPDNPTDDKMRGSEVSSTVPQRAARHSVGLRRARIKPITARTAQG